MVDPCIAVALIAVRENHVPYHSNCQAFPHSGDVEGIRLLRSLYPVSHTPAEDVEDPNSARAESDLRIEELEYSDIGKLIHPELLHDGKSELTEGHIGFQSEGAEIHFRNMRVKEGKE